MTTTTRPELTPLQQAEADYVAAHAAFQAARDRFKAARSEQARLQPAADRALQLLEQRRAEAETVRLLGSDAGLLDQLAAAEVDVTMAERERSSAQHRWVALQNSKDVTAAGLADGALQVVDDASDAVDAARSRATAISTRINGLVSAARKREADALAAAEEAERIRRRQARNRSLTERVRAWVGA